MAAVIRVEVADVPTADVIHRFRNFGEDVCRVLRERCAIDIQEIESSTTSFLIREIRNSEVGVVREVVERELRRHNFAKTSKLVRL